jgi:hypothetical protein
VTEIDKHYATQGNESFFLDVPPVINEKKFCYGKRAAEANSRHASEPVIIDGISVPGTEC